MGMTPERRASRRRYDAKRSGSEARRLYKTRAWRVGRLLHLGEHPLCVMCKRDGRTTAGTVVDHIVPHRGDRHLFMDRSNWQTLCDYHHDVVKQREEARGYADALDVDGWPVDTRHPANGGAR
jgi:5-methylcytosine-specific restriction endonuclease McrA